MDVLLVLKIGPNPDCRVVGKGFEPFDLSQSQYAYPLPPSIYLPWDEISHWYQPAGDSRGMESGFKGKNSVLEPLGGSKLTVR